MNDYFDINKVILELYQDCVNDNVTNVYQTISHFLDENYDVQLTPEAIRSRLRRMRGGCTQTTLLDDEKILIQNGYNPSDFELVSARISSWDNMNGDKKQSQRVTVKPKKSTTEDIWDEERIQNIFDGIRVRPILSPIKSKNFESGKALVLPIADLHYGLYATDVKSGMQYNCITAENILWRIVCDVIERTKDVQFEKVYFIIGNDMLHVDNKNNTTTHGTPQDTDGFVEENLINLTNLLVNCIELLRNQDNIKNVEIVHIPGNHDYHTGLGIANTLRIAYYGCEDVEVDYNCSMRKYKVFGNTLIGMAHDINIKKINDIIQSDARQLLSNTSNTVYLLAHLHHEYAVDVSGTDVRRLPSVCALSSWTYEQGYSSRRKNQSFIIDMDYGITDVIYSI